MSVNFGVSGALLAPTTTALSSSSETDVFVADLGIAATVIGIVVASIDGSNACHVTLRWNDGSTSYVLWTGDVAADETVTPDVPPVLLNPAAADGAGVAKKITAQASTGGDLVVTVVATASMPQQTNGAPTSSRRG